MEDDQRSGSHELGLIGLLLLEDGYFFLGRSFGFSNQIRISGEQVFAVDTVKLCGELCFNTGMSGYQEVLSDPSYAGQMICFSFPHIGNVGCNDEDYECAQPQALAMISREHPTEPSNWRSGSTLLAWLERHGISGISGMDTRALIRHLREHGSKRALLGTLSPELLDGGRLKPDVLAVLLQHLLTSPSMTGQDLASQVTCSKAKPYQVSAKWAAQKSHFGPSGKLLETPKKFVRSGASDLQIAVLDLGIKENILRSIKCFASKVTVLPLGSCWSDLIAIRPSGLLLSNGPGDPEPVYQKVAGILEQSFAARLPIFGICLGHQILALSLGAKTAHMHHGHRGINHPVCNILRNTVEITTQNHGFCVIEDSLPQGLEVTHRSLFDSSIEGIRSLDYRPFRCSITQNPPQDPTTVCICFAILSS